jgi:hypothetical protein
LIKKLKTIKSNPFVCIVTPRGQGCKYVNHCPRGAKLASFLINILKNGSSSISILQPSCNNKDKSFATMAKLF